MLAIRCLSAVQRTQKSGREGLSHGNAQGGGGGGGGGVALYAAAAVDSGSTFFAEVVPEPLRTGEGSSGLGVFARLEKSAPEHDFVPPTPIDSNAHGQRRNFKGIVSSVVHALRGGKNTEQIMFVMTACHQIGAEDAEEYLDAGVGADAGLAAADADASAKQRAAGPAKVMVTVRLTKKVFSKAKLQTVYDEVRSVLSDWDKHNGADVTPLNICVSGSVQDGTAKSSAHKPDPGVRLVVTGVAEDVVLLGAPEVEDIVPVVKNVVGVPLAFGDKGIVGDQSIRESLLGDLFPQGHLWLPRCNTIRTKGTDFVDQFRHRVSAFRRYGGIIYLGIELEKLEGSDIAAKCTGLPLTHSEREALSDQLASCFNTQSPALRVDEYTPDSCSRAGCEVDRVYRTIFMPERRAGAAAHGEPMRYVLRYIVTRSFSSPLQLAKLSDHHLKVRGADGKRDMALLDFTEGIREVHQMLNISAAACAEPCRQLNVAVGSGLEFMQHVTRAVEGPMLDNKEGPEGKQDDLVEYIAVDVVETYGTMWWNNTGATSTTDYFTVFVGLKVNESSRCHYARFLKKGP